MGARETFARFPKDKGSAETPWVLDSYSYYKVNPTGKADLEGADQVPDPHGTDFQNLKGQVVLGSSAQRGRGPARFTSGARHQPITSAEIPP